VTGFDEKRYTDSETGRWLLRLLMRDDVFARLILCTDEVCEALPEARRMIGFDQRNPHHPYDVWIHTAHGVASIAPDPVLRLAMFMHDTGKPDTFYLAEDDVGHFNKHEVRGEQIVRERLPELGFDADMVETIALLVLNHDRGISEKELWRLVADLGEEWFRSLLDIKEADARSHDEKYKNNQLARVDELRRILNES